MLIILSGKARCGKDTFAGILKNLLKRDYILIAYADELKKKCMEDFNLSYGQVYGNLKEVPDHRYIKDNGGYWTPREILQFIGTDCYRKISNDYWIDKVMSYIGAEELHNVIITDARFPNEISKPKELGAFHIRISRDNPDGIHGVTHLSETALDECDNIDFVVNNNKTIADLEIEAQRIIDEIKIL